MTNSEKAYAIKAYLVNLAINDELPMDMNDLSVQPIIDILEGRDANLDYHASKAEYWLIGNDETSVEEMVERIRNHENQDDLIDYVEGVVVWEPLEFTTTCGVFMEEILKSKFV